MADFKIVSSPEVTCHASYTTEQFASGNYYRCFSFNQWINVTCEVSGYDDIEGGILSEALLIADQSRNKHGHEIVKLVTSERFSALNNLSNGEAIRVPAYLKRNTRNRVGILRKVPQKIAIRGPYTSSLAGNLLSVADKTLRKLQESASIGPDERRALSSQGKIAGELAVHLSDLVDTSLLDIPAPTVSEVRDRLLALPGAW